MRTIYIIGIDNDPDGCYITDALEKPEHTIAGPFHSQQNAITHAIDAELRVHSRWNEILPGPNRDDFGERLEDLQRYTLVGPQTATRLPHGFPTRARGS
jgi:hypothetical protein